MKKMFESKTYYESDKIILRISLKYTVANTDKIALSSIRYFGYKNMTS